jgi:TRAP-type mannitol/chloroaromatic compound transport system substrate-binding protein
MGGWFNKEINSADDLKGLKMRMPGLGGDVLAKLGASPVALPPGQIYENLVAGTIDATEWAGPYNDYFMKLYEAAKFYYSPGFHEPGGSLCLGMNKSWWEALYSHRPAGHHRRQQRRAPAHLERCHRQQWRVPGPHDP